MHGECDLKSPFSRNHLMRLDVPEDDVRLRLVGPRERVDDRVGEVGPLVVGADVGKVYEGVDSERNPQGAAFPGTS